jgi:probable addiction module antidote protein
MVTETFPYDVAKTFNSQEEMAAYIGLWLEEAPDDIPGIMKALGDVARAQGMTNIANTSGLSRESLYKSLSAEGNPSFATILKVMSALGLRLHTVAV